MSINERREPAQINIDTAAGKHHIMLPSSGNEAIDQAKAQAVAESSDAMVAAFWDELKKGNYISIKRGADGEMRAEVKNVFEE